MGIGGWRAVGVYVKVYGNNVPGFICALGRIFLYILFSF